MFWAAGRAISRESVQGYVTWLGEMKFSPSTINQRLAAIRKLATEAQRCGYVDSETAQAIVSVSGVRQKGRRLGRWLAWEEARTLLQAPNPHSIRGMRDRALLAVLVTCAMRRGELSRSAKRRLCRRLLEVAVAVRRVEVEGDESIRVVEGDGELAAEGSRAGTTWQWRSSPLSAMTTARALATAIKNLQPAVKKIVDRRAGDAEILTGNFVRKKLRW